MKSLTKARPRSKPSRSVRLYEGTPALVSMTIGSEQADYWLAPIPDAAFGQGYTMTKAATAENPEPGTPYAVNVDGERSTCECKGHLRWGHCRHVESLLALQKAGRLPSPPASLDPIDQAALDEHETARLTPWDDL
jgi:hypothetical protein